MSLISGALTLGLVIAAVAVFGLLILDREVDTAGPLDADKVVIVPKGSGTTEIATQLQQDGVITQPALFEFYAYLNRRRGALRAGEYLFKAHTTIDEAIETLISGKPIQHAFTAPEGLTSEQILGRLRESDVLVGDLMDTPREGSLLPDTYKFERGTTRQQVVNMMQSAQREALAKAWARRSPDVPIKTPQELVILASIVEKETGRADERPRVASVFLNRLAKRMKLQSDPTIVYGIVGGKGTLGRPILRSEIERATPFNTYVIEGLPPSPIANPGRAALEAVAAPAKTKDLFFVADGTGGHAFAETLAQHQQNVLRWRQIERAREAATPSEGPVDRVDQPAGPDARTDATGLPTGASAYLAAPTPGGGSSSGFDAVEGTSRDPLQNRSWDLTSPKSVPAASSAEQAPRREAAQPASRRAKPRL